ncbi:MAG: LysR family transcriptional regulator [Oscillospiraceae bacterium]|nr:LysR family transcriptional regulator [Oscillospiraceae bacterium]
MTLQQLIYFREVAKTCHFTRAAENLFVSQSSLSHSVQELESEIGAPLFLRKNGKKISLTKYGECFLEYVERALAEIENGQKALQLMISPNGTGTVNIAYTYINGESIVPDFLEAFYQRPESKAIFIHSVVNHGGKGFIEEAISSCQADLAFSCASFEDSRHIVSERIAAQELFAALPAAHPLAEREVISLRELQNENVIMYAGAMNLYEHVVSMFKSEGINPNFVDGVTDWTVQLREVAQGAGIAILPKIHVDPCRIRFVKISSAHNIRDVYLLSPADRKLSPSAEYVRKKCIEYFQGKT